MLGLFDVCTLALNGAKISFHYDRFAISVPARSLLLFDLAQQDENKSGPKGQRDTRGTGEISEATFYTLKNFRYYSVRCYFVLPLGLIPHFWSYYHFFSSNSRNRLVLNPVFSYNFRNKLFLILV